MTARRRKDTSTPSWEAGFATALSILQSGWREHGLVVMVLGQSGLTYDDLKAAGATQYDLRLIREAFKQNGSQLRPAKVPPQRKKKAGKRHADVPELSVEQIEEALRTSAPGANELLQNLRHSFMLPAHDLRLR